MKIIMKISRFFYNKKITHYLGRHCQHWVTEEKQTLLGFVIKRNLTTKIINA